MALASPVMVWNSSFAQTLHEQTLEEIVKENSGLNENPQLDVSAQINVGDSPTAMIPAIGELLDTRLLYVVNSGSDTVSVISPENNTKIKDIPVGVSPADIDGDFNPDTVYVANMGSDTVSVISPENNTKIKDIPVGVDPIDIDIRLDTVYVANSGSGGLSVIDTVVNKAVAGVTYWVNPPNSGYVTCDGLAVPSPIGQYMYVYSGTECTAKPNKGFEFVSWEQNLDGNSTQSITTSHPASNWDSFLNLLGFESSDEPEANLNITKFGTFTANFKELPPALPPEYLIPLYGIIASTIVGWSIPSIIGWTKSKRDIGKLKYYHKQITAL